MVPELHRAVDLARDQSWFLFATTREQLALHAVPAGRDGRTSGRCAREAERLGLPVAAKPDSQDICFVPSGHYADTVVRLRPDAGEPGDIVDAGRPRAGAARRDRALHRGAGQAARRGLGRWRRSARSVVALDPARRRVVVGPRDSGTRMVRLREVNWLVPPPDRAAGLPGEAARARGAAAGDGARPRSPVAPRCGWTAPALPAPGQACVFYDGSRVLGGGFICRPDGGDG